VDWIGLAQDRGKWRALVNAVMKQWKYWGSRRADATQHSVCSINVSERASNCYMAPCPLIILSSPRWLRDSPLFAKVGPPLLSVGQSSWLQI
jgi:hypothetical protein